MGTVLNFKQKTIQVKKQRMLTNEQRERFFVIMDGDLQNIHPILYQLLNLIHKIDPYIPYLLVLDWLIINKITGKNFNEWYLKEHKRSILSMGSFIVAMIKKNRPGRLVDAKRDFILDS